MHIITEDIKWQTPLVTLYNKLLEMSSLHFVLFRFGLVLVYFADIRDTTTVAQGQSYDCPCGVSLKDRENCKM